MGFHCLTQRENSPLVVKRVFPLSPLLQLLHCLFAGRCDLTYYSGSQFLNTARVHPWFLWLIRSINNFASSCNVKVCESHVAYEVLNKCQIILSSRVLIIIFYLTFLGKSVKHRVFLHGGGGPSPHLSCKRRSPSNGASISPYKCKLLESTLDTVCNSIASLDNLGWIRQTLMRLYNEIESSFHLIYKNLFSIKQYQFPPPHPPN